jgi:hypothetical protein
MVSITASLTGFVGAGKVHPVLNRALISSKQFDADVFMGDSWC